MIFRVIALLYMAVNTVTDARRKEIDIRFTVAAGILLVLLRVFGFSRGLEAYSAEFCALRCAFCGKPPVSRCCRNRRCPGGRYAGIPSAGHGAYALYDFGILAGGRLGTDKKRYGSVAGRRAEIPLVPFVLLAYVMGCCL